MKRLKKISGADRVQNISINQSLSYNLIMENDPEFETDLILLYNNSSNPISYGAISDDGDYIVEMYLYEIEETEQLKAAYVIDTLDNDGQPLNEPQVVIRNVNDYHQAVHDLTGDGIILPRGGHLTFYNEYSNFDQINTLESE